MKVLCINGSPRENGNTAALLKTMLEVFADQGWETEAVQLNKLDFKGCQGCMTCKNKTDHCVQNDDMTPIYDKIQESEVVLMGTPVYLWDVTGQFKLFLDRCFAFWDRPFTGRIQSGKTAILIVPQGQPKAKLGETVIEKYSYLMKSWGFSGVHAQVFKSLNSRRDIEKHPEYLEQARDLAQKVIADH
jgi:multimeric flavodoxin WrbA